MPLADVHWASQLTVIKNPSVNAGDVRHARHTGLIPGSERFPRGGHGNSLQYFCLENPMNRGDWWATVHGITVRHNWSNIACSMHGCSLKATFSFTALFSICDYFTHTHTHTHTQSLERLVVHFLVKPTPDQMPLEGFILTWCLLVSTLNGACCQNTVLRRTHKPPGECDKHMDFTQNNAQTHKRSHSKEDSPA